MTADQHSVPRQLGISPVICMKERKVHIVNLLDKFKEYQGKVIRLSVFLDRDDEVQRKQDAQDKNDYWNEQVADLVEVLTKVMELLEPGSTTPAVDTVENEHVPSPTSASPTSSPFTSPGVTTIPFIQPPYTGLEHLSQPSSQFLSSVPDNPNLTQAPYSTPLFPSHPSFHPNPYGLANTHVSFPSPNSIPMTTMFGPNAPVFSHHQQLFFQQYLSGP